MGLTSVLPIEVPHGKGLRLLGDDSETNQRSGYFFALAVAIVVHSLVYLSIDAASQQKYPSIRLLTRQGIFRRSGEGRPDVAHDKTSVFAALILAASACLVSAQDRKVSMIGIGRKSYAHWRSTQAHQLEETVWTYGFWTGLNCVTAASDQTQAKINVAAIVAEFEKTCAHQTSQTLASAVWTTYLGSKKWPRVEQLVAILGSVMLPPDLRYWRRARCAAELRGSQASAP